MTINRYVVKNKHSGYYFDGDYNWSPNIWEAKLYEDMPFMTVSTNSMVVLVSVDIKEYPYEMVVEQP